MKGETFKGEVGKAQKRRVLLGINLVVFFTAAIVLLSVNSFAFQNEPDGFRGIKWGTDISGLQGMTHVRTDPSYGGVEFYTRKGDELRFGDVQLEKIAYAFWKGKFASVWIHSGGYANWYALHDAVFEKFGEGYQPHRFIEQYIWSGTSTAILLNYNEITKQGTLFMYSQTIAEQQEEYDKQKPKKGQKRNFKLS
jgi:hypothetical protein